MRRKEVARLLAEHAERLLDMNAKDMAMKGRILELEEMHWNHGQRLDGHADEINDVKRQLARKADKRVRKAAAPRKAAPAKKAVRKHVAKRAAKTVRGH